MRQRPSCRFEHYQPALCFAAWEVERPAGTILLRERRLFQLPSRSDSFLTRLSNDIDQRRFAFLDAFNGPAKCSTEIFWIRNRTFGIPAQALSQSCEIDVGILEFGSNVRVSDSTLMAVCHALDVHHFLMVGTIVIH